MTERTLAVYAERWAGAEASASGAAAATRAAAADLTAQTTRAPRPSARHRQTRQLRGSAQRRRLDELEPRVGAPAAREAVVDGGGAPLRRTTDGEGARASRVVGQSRLGGRTDQRDDGLTGAAERRRSAGRPAEHDERRTRAPPDEPPAAIWRCSRARSRTA